ncbi:MAG: NAD-dependent epimerase/dehydratase family protein [Alphaproteobacteria bacterium]|nr:MAG: NAD-dependent epimerase/dehydratase family protein [Alphaproteobacteria bacterium]
MTRALVTGAAGFVGSAVVRALLREGVAVRALMRASSRSWTLDGLPVERVVGDLRDPACRRRILRDIDVLFHVAADYRLWVRDPAALYATNVDATRALYREALDRGVACIVHTGTVATLRPRADGTPADEGDRGRLSDMIGHYKRSKFLAEEVALDLCRQENAPIVIVQPSSPVGPRDARPTPTGRILVEAACGRMPGYVETGLNIVHVDDVATGHILAWRRGRPGERYILGGENLWLKDILTRIAHLTGARPPRWRLPIGLVRPVALACEMAARVLPAYEPFVNREAVRMAEYCMFFSSRKAESALGYRARPADEALRDALDWFHAFGYISCAPHGRQAA